MEDLQIRSARWLPSCHKCCQIFGITSCIGPLPEIWKMEFKIFQAFKSIEMVSAYISRISLTGLGYLESERNFSLAAKFSPALHHSSWSLHTVEMSMLCSCLYTGTKPTQVLPHAYAEWKGCLRGSFLEGPSRVPPRMCLSWMVIYQVNDR